MDVQAQDEDISNLANGFQIVGDTDPTTKQPIRANFEDTLSFAQYGQIDASPVANANIKDVATAQSYAIGLANEQAFPQESFATKIFVRNDNTAAAIPASNTGLADGDQCYGFENILITGFDATDISTNNVPDPGIALTGVGVSVWNLGSKFTVSSAPVVAGAPFPINAFYMAGTGASITANANGVPILVAPGLKCTFQGWANAVHSGSTGSLGFQILDWISGTQLATSYIALGTSGATPTVTFTIPAGTSRLQVRAVVNGCTIPTGQNIALFGPTLSFGLNALPYANNQAAPSVYGLASSVVCHMDGLGDRYQTINFQPLNSRPSTRG